MTVSFKLRNSPCLYVFLCPCPKSSFHTLTAVTPNRSTSASATLQSANGKLWQSHSFWKGHLLCKSSLKISWFAIYDPQNPNSVGRWELLHKKKELMGPSLFLTSFSYTAFPSPYSNCPLDSCKGSWSHLSPWKSDRWKFSDRRRNLNPGTQSPISRCLGAAQPVKFLHSWDHFPTGGTQALSELSSHSWHAAAGGRTVPGMFKGSRSWRQGWGNGSCRDPGTLTLSYCCFQQSLATATFASNIWESLYRLLMAIKGIPVPIFEPGASIYYWLYISAGL